MKIDPPKDAALIINSTGVGTVTEKMVRERAVELAVIDGRTAQEVSTSDWEQAKRELTNESDQDPKEALLESAPESERWDPLPGSTGRVAVSYTHLGSHPVPYRARSDVYKRQMYGSHGRW